jgi:hypothetical protein
MPEQTPPQPIQTPPPAQPAQSAQPAKSGSNKTLLIIIAAVIVLGLLGAGGYFIQQKFAEKTGEKAAETALEKASGGKANVDVSEGGDKVSIKTDEGSVTMGGGSVPKNWPSDVTVYKGAKVTGSAETDEGLSLMLETSDSVEKVYEFYKSDLPSKGWSLSMNATYGGASMLQGEKSGKGVMLSVSKNEDSGKTAIAISVTTTP